MKRTTKENQRARILNDDELRTVWHAAEANGQFGALVQLLLLTGQRLAKVKSMRWQDVDINGVWHIPTEPREKGHGGPLQLPKQALSILNAQPRLAGSPFVFTSRYRSGFPKATFDAECGVTGWVLHDLRRTARSLLSRANVRPDIAERVLGHVVGGVAGIYDRHSYADEKADAVRRLAALVDRIVTAPTDNVVPMVAS
jgi:integrase